MTRKEIRAPNGAPKEEKQKPKRRRRKYEAKILL